MSNGHSVKNKAFEKMFVAIVVALVLVVVILLVVFRVNSNKPQSDDVGDNITASGDVGSDGSGDTDSVGNSDNDSVSEPNDMGNGNAVNENSAGNNGNTDSGNSSGGSNGGSNSGNTTGGGSSGNSGNGNSSNADNNNSNNNNDNNDSSGDADDNNNNNNSDNNDSGNTDNKPDEGDNDNGGNSTGGEDTTVSPPNVEITERADADYEQWLAATMVVCVSMEYPDFEIKGIYTSSETTFSNKYSSDGAYIVFTSGGQTMAIHSVAISTERTAVGTKDISSQTLGYATFDAVSPSSVNTSGMTEIDVDDLDELIEQSLLISVYTH